MKSFSAQLLPTKQAEILETWMKLQLKEEGLRSDLMSSDSLRQESEQLLKAVLDAIKKDNFTDINAQEYDKANEVLAGISLNRAANGFSPRETAYFVFSLKEALTSTVEKNIPDTKDLYA